MLRTIKKLFAIIIIVVLLPYIITVFVNGGEKEQTVKTKKEDKLLKQYCISVLAREVSSDYEDEMLKAQALLVRTTVYKEVEEKGQSFIEEKKIDELDEIDKDWYRKLEKIWNATEGEVILYQDKLALVPFHQLSNGKTRVGAEVLGSEEYPYLKSKECPKDATAENQIENKFIEVKGATVTQYDSVGYALSVTVGEETCSGEQFRTTYELASGCFELQEFENNTRVVTKGIGHGLGLSQYTANEMAKEGKTYKEILQYFFEGTEIKEVAEILWIAE